MGRHSGGKNAPKRKAPTHYAGPRETSTHYAGDLKEAGLRDFDKSLEFAAFVCARAGLRLVLDEDQAWAVGGSRLRVCLWRDRRNYIVLLVRSGWPSPRSPKSLPLANVLAIAVTGVIRLVRGPLLGTWKRVGLVLAGLVPPCPVTLPSLPDDAPPAAARLWAFLKHYLGVRKPGDSFPLVAPRLEELSVAYGQRIGRGTIVAGRSWLDQRGFLEHVDDAQGHYGHPTKLWRVGTGTTQRAARTRTPRHADDGRL